MEAEKGLRGGPGSPLEMPTRVMQAVVKAGPLSVLGMAMNQGYREVDSS